jgi:DNA-binding NtrC family response regulator
MAAAQTLGEATTGGAAMSNPQTTSTEPCPAGRVLLAEDDPAMRALLARRLRRAGFDVIEARNGVEALERLAFGWVGTPRIRFDVVVSDVRMPGYDGLNILASLRQTTAHLPIILITAFGTTATHATAARLGAYAILDKPFDLDHLIALVKEAARVGAPSSPPVGCTQGG